MVGRADIEESGTKQAEFRAQWITQSCRTIVNLLPTDLSARNHERRAVPGFDHARQGTSCEETEFHGPLSFAKNKRKEWTPCSPSILRREKGGSTIRMVKVLRRRGRSGGAHIEGREGAACPDTLCPDNDDDGDDHDGHDVVEVPAPSWIPLSVRR